MSRRRRRRRKKTSSGIVYNLLFLDYTTKELSMRIRGRKRKKNHHRKKDEEVGVNKIIAANLFYDN